jgi:hypothetical protein
VITRFLKQFWQSFDDAILRAQGQCQIAGQTVHEDPDELGYRLLQQNGSITPSIFRGTVATQETQDILCEIMPALDWLKIEENAHEPYEIGLDNYVE